MCVIDNVVRDERFNKGNKRKKKNNTEANEDGEIRDAKYNKDYKVLDMVERCPKYWACSFSLHYCTSAMI